MSSLSPDTTFTTLKDRCMNSLVNLRPACQRCNTSRQNPLKF